MIIVVCCSTNSVYKGDVLSHVCGPFGTIAEAESYLARKGLTKNDKQIPGVRSDYYEDRQWKRIYFIEEICEPL